MFTAKSTKQSKFNLTLHNKTARLCVIYHNYFNHHQFISFDERCVPRTAALRCNLTLECARKCQSA